MKKAYTSAVLMLRALSNLDFFGWVHEDYRVDAVAYIPLYEANKLLNLMNFPEGIRKQGRVFVHSNFIKVVFSGINMAPLVQDLWEFGKSQSKTRLSPVLTFSESRVLRICTISMPTGSFAKLSPRTVEQQAELFREHVTAAYGMMMKDKPFLPDELAICVLPEFYSHCSDQGSNRLFMSHSTQQSLLARYCLVSKDTPGLLIMVNITATTANEAIDDLGVKIGHRPKIQKTNILFGLKDGTVVYMSYKLNKGPADIPDEELLFSETERNSYYHAKVDKELMKLAYLKQFKGITFAGTVCIDAYEGVLGKYLQQQYPQFNEDELGPAIQIISSSSMALPLGFKKRSELNPGQVVTPKQEQGLIIQADGHDKERRSGVWLVHGEDFSRLNPYTKIRLNHQVCIEGYSVLLKTLHNRLNSELDADIDEISNSEAVEESSALDAKAF
ncbi:hypothetical protein EAS68_01030 [Legionella jordanis]|uniref:hypothetical protein n=1 Tax=Legionella jordanis TaxID=456 RepID=UPI000F003657|nr:hypothetical protein [Legionella jordanis]RMX22145.1 hypothetical protein EAS68_01030 [Legionella jordanis]